MAWRQRAVVGALAVLGLLAAGVALVKRPGPAPGSAADRGALDTGRLPPSRSSPVSVTLPRLGDVSPPEMPTLIDVAGFGVEAVCGLGPLNRRWATVAPGDERMALVLPPETDAGPAAAAVDQLIQSLRHASRPRQRGAGWMMQRESPAAEPLAQLAMASHDPVIAHWAVSACWAADPRSRPPCTALARRWAQLEPDNAAAWLAVLDGDPGAESEVMEQVALARRFDEHVGELLREAAQAAPPTWPAAVRLQMMRQAAQDDARGVASYAPLLQHCAPERLADADRRQRCEAVAELMLGQGRTVAAHAFGLHLAERLTWPDARLTTLREAQARVNSAVLAEAQRVQRRGSWACASVQAELRHLDALASRGQWSALAALER